MSLNREKKQKLNTGLAILFGILCLACIIWLMVYLVQTLTAEEKNEQLKEEYVTEEETTEATSVEESVMESDVEEASTEENVQEAESESSLKDLTYRKRPLILQL